jgi:hemoglobin
MRISGMRSKRGLILLFGASISLGGCSGPASLYESLGGLATMEHLGDSLVIEIGNDPVLFRRFKGFSIADVQRQRTANVVFACALAGGPCHYDGGSVDQIHRGMDISDDEFNRMIALFAAAVYRASPDRFAVEVFIGRFEALRPMIVSPSSVTHAEPNGSG